MTYPDTVVVEIPRETARALVYCKDPHTGPVAAVAELVAEALLTSDVEVDGRPGGWVERLTGRGYLDDMRRRQGWERTS